MSLSWRAEPVADRGPADDVPETFATYAPFFLERLYRLSTLKRLTRLTPLERRLVDRATCSTYWDCVDVDARDEAIEIIDDTIRG